MLSASQWTSSNLSVGCLGPKGQVGPAGPSGIQGPTGVSGVSGSNETTGGSGPSGQTGPSGPRGASGPYAPNDFPLVNAVISSRGNYNLTFDKTNRYGCVVVTRIGSNGSDQSLQVNAPQVGSNALVDGDWILLKNATTLPVTIYYSQIFTILPASTNLISTLWYIRFQNSTLSIY